MDYTELLEAVNAKNATTLEDYLKYDVVVPCIEGEGTCTITYHTPPELLLRDDFIKPKLFRLDNTAVIKTSDTSYNVHIRAQYIDTVAHEDGFAKVNVALKLEGKVTPEQSLYQVYVFVVVSEFI